MNRKKLSRHVEADVLDKSRRRCCICFALHRDISLKRGQIAHLDGDKSNDALENLAYLCLEHHDEYDSTTSQSKGLTLTEVKRYRDELYRGVISMLEPRAFPMAPAGNVDPQTAGANFEVRRSRERKAALLELLPQTGAVYGPSHLALRLGLTSQTIQRLLLELVDEGVVRADRAKGTLKTVYSLATSEENRLMDAFVASLGERVLSENRYIRRREVELDAVVTTSSATYVVQTLIARKRIDEADVRRRIGRVSVAKRQMGLDGSTSTLLIGIADTTVCADVDLKHIEEEGVLVRFVELA